MPYGWRNPPAPAGGEQNQGRGVTGVKGGSRTGRQQAVSRRLAFLLAASQSVAARLDEDDALDAFARIAVTAMADLCISPGSLADSGETAITCRRGSVGSRQLSAGCSRTRDPALTACASSAGWACYVRMARIRPNTVMFSGARGGLGGTSGVRLSG